MVESERSHDKFEWPQTRGRDESGTPPVSSSSPETTGPQGYKQNPKGYCSCFHPTIREAHARVSRVQREQAPKPPDNPVGSARFHQIFQRSLCRLKPPEALCLHSAGQPHQQLSPWPGCPEGKEKAAFLLQTQLPWLVTLQVQQIRGAAVPKSLGQKNKESKHPISKMKTLSPRRES